MSKARPGVSSSRGRGVQSWGRAGALLLCWILSSACGGGLSGRWLGVEVESLDGTVSAARAGWAKGTSLTFSGATLTVALPGETPRRGVYRVVSEDDGQLSIAIAGHDGHIDRTALTLETDRLLRWHLTSVHTLVMQRE